MRHHPSSKRTAVQRSHRLLRRLTCRVLPEAALQEQVRGAMHEEHAQSSVVCPTSTGK